MKRSVIAVWALVLAAAACTGSGGTSPTPGPASPAFARGGTLRVIVPSEGSFLEPIASGAPALDPQGDFFLVSEELFRCCLTRTLLSYNGQSTELGGAELRPDLTASLPSISADGLTWTFRLRRGLRYAPPLQQVEITARDVVRGIERAAASKACPDCATDLLFYDVQGVHDFVGGRSAHISGLETPDSHTLVVHLTAPAGDLGNRLASVVTSPVPASPSDPAASAGVGTGHDDDYGRFLVASGPYMVQGSESVDFSVPADQQQPATGFAPGRSINLVRNPSWRTDGDSLRAAYPDVIEIAIGGTLEDGSAKVEAGTADLVLFPGSPPQVPLDQFERYQSDPKLRPSLHFHSSDVARNIFMNVAQPPFDDVHVRKALNYVIDKQRLLDLRGGRPIGEIATHLLLNSLENNLLVDYDPYRTKDRAEAVTKAKAEMRQSRYDADHDGECDAEVCRRVTGRSVPLLAELIAPITQDLRRIGIHATITATEPPFDDLGKPSNHIGLAVNIGFLKGYLNAAPALQTLTSSFLSDEGAQNFSLLGATPQQLRRWGYPVRTVPSVDANYQQCVPLVGQAQFQCWAEMDQLLMEEVVPMVPLVFEAYVRTVSDRVASYSFDQSVAFPALDRIALKLGSE